jgi:leader peptidase (prepilin peptidase)/N-methyltransferase
VISDQSSPATERSDPAAEPSSPASEATGIRAAHPALAIGAGVAGAVLALAVLGLGSRGLVAACFLGAMGALAVIDFRTRLLPNRIVLPAAAIVLALQLALFPDDAIEWIAASLGCFVVLLVIALAKPGGIGMGDAKLGLLLGAGLGADVTMALLIGCLALWPVAAYLLLRDGADARKAALPLGPALALGAAVVALTG